MEIEEEEEREDGRERENRRDRIIVYKRLGEKANIEKQNKTKDAR